MKNQSIDLRFIINLNYYNIGTVNGIVHRFFVNILFVCVVEQGPNRVASSKLNSNSRED